MEYLFYESGASSKTIEVWMGCTDTRIARFFFILIYQNGDNITNAHKIFLIAIK
jgi:hypothetical protein